MGATSQQNIKRILTLQKKAVCTVFNSAYNAHTFELFKNLNTLPFDKLLVYQRAVFMHSIRYNYAPVSFAETWPLNDVRNLNYNLRNVSEFFVTPPRFEGFRRFPIYSFPTVWNNLDNIKLQSNKTTFCIELKRSLLENV
jgi:hypothetical protein